MDLTSPVPFAIDDGGGSTESKSATNSATGVPRDVVAEVDGYYAQWRQDRRPHEVQWFTNAAFIDGKHYMKWNPILNRLENRKAPAHRSRNAINRIAPKVRARLAKFVKQRPYPQVIPANTDRQSVLDAKATEKAIDYLWRKLGLETKYEDAVLWAMTTGKAFWWFRWDTNVNARVQMPGPEYGFNNEVVEAPLGEVSVEVGTAFELLVQDQGVPRIADQPRIMRVKARPARETELRFGLNPGAITPDTTTSDLFQYQRQIAQVGAQGLGSLQSNDKDGQGNYTHVIVKELFERPNAEFPKGRYVVVAGGQVLRDDDALPVDFTNSANPYPVVEFMDQLSPGRFWPTTMAEQLIGIQKEYNDLRNKINEQLKLTMHPKLLVPKQAQLSPNAYNSEAGEKIEFHFIPGMPLPQHLAAANVSADAWRAIETIKVEFDDLSSIYPASVGGVGDTGESGFQTNLLQEAADSIHAPDIRRCELAVEEAAFKMRRIMSIGYDVPRLLSIVGKNHKPDVFEFSTDNIDEHAHVIVQAGSALPTLKAARGKMIMEMFSEGLFGDPADPGTKRRVLGMLEVGGVEDATDMVKRDEDQARLENLDVSKNVAIDTPMPWENHQIHYEFHTDVLKSPEIKQWTPEQRDELLRHTILHAKFINPQSALMWAQMFGYQDLVQQIMPMIGPTQAPQESAGGPQPSQPTGQAPSRPGAPPTPASASQQPAAQAQAARPAA